MAKSAAQKAAEKAAKEAAKKSAGECPVTDAPCEKNCKSDECQATVSNDVAQKLLDEGKAEIPAEAVVQSSSKKSDYASHPKFDKFKSIQGAE